MVQFILNRVKTQKLFWSPLKGTGEERCVAIQITGVEDNHAALKAKPNKKQQQQKKTKSEKIRFLESFLYSK